ncbi:MAG: efflux RND transporter periplasmic adaptor subunit [Pseudomonadota bacterium]
MLAVATLATILPAGGYWSQFARYRVETNDAYVTGNLVPLVAQSTGTVIEVAADDTEFTPPGRTLVRLNGAHARLALEAAEAQLGETVRTVANRFATVEELRARMDARRAALIRIEHDLARYREVSDSGAVPEQQIQNAEDQHRELAAQLRADAAALQAVEAQVRGADIGHNPSVLRAASTVRAAYLELQRCEVKAPVAGFIAKRSAQPGQRVTPGTPLLAIVPLQELWVDANVKEDRLGRVRPGQAVTMTAALYGKQVVYHGRVLGLGAGTGSIFGLLPPENASGNYIHIVERLPVRISLDAAELRAHPLRPGLSMEVSIDTRGGGPVLQPLTTTPGGAWRTAVYKRELANADTLVHRIIAANIGDRR